MFGGNTMEVKNCSCAEIADEYMEEAKRVFYEDKFVEASLLMHNAIKLYEKSGNTDELAEGYNVLGVIYAAMGDGVNAIDYYLKGLEIANKQGLFDVVARIYNNIGSEYQKIGKHEKGLEYFLKAANIFRHLNQERYPRYNVWMLLICLNIGISYTEIGNLEDAKIYIDATKEYLEKDENRECEFDILISECQLKWAMGDKKFVYDNVDRICGELMDNISTTDYVPEMENICDLLKKMEEYDRWGKIITTFEEQANIQDSFYYRLSCVEMWMDYYKTIGMREKYIEKCVRHTELYLQQKESKNEEQCNNIDMRIELHNKESERLAAEMASNKDNLTGVYNRQKLENDFQVYAKESHNGRLGIGIIDVDWFKEQNDSFGHVHGDECLKKVAYALENAVGDNGTVYRYGGDEFVIMFENADYKIVETVAENIKKNIAGLKIANANEVQNRYLSVSQGYALIPKVKGNQSVYSILKLADRALYTVKRNGRNDYKIFL